MILTSNELLGFMSPKLATEIFENLAKTDKDLYRLTLSSVAEARKVRPIFLEHKTRSDRHAAMISTLSRPSMETVAGNLIRGWLMKHHLPMISRFLTKLGVDHQEGVIEDLPPQIDDAKLKAAVDDLLSEYPPEIVSVYLQAFYSMNETNWANLKSLLETEPKLQLGA